jgi:hypothetical protein
MDGEGVQLMVTKEHATRSLAERAVGRAKRRKWAWLRLAPVDKARWRMVQVAA